ncbi:hypothetical protein Bpfe_009103 [Biomphalaria pfeifferi]|uniref:Uncharacterized protein n=1 Tax=Biomphalaria pfeifferi TaxID=112525 RepID=A0AAD8BWE6_BIOPF|nr:hypothetical protein Bpfe_009103 [Biomphalaria pfeifferi]
MNCATTHECYAIGEEDSDQFMECMIPCWSYANACYRLCSQSVDDVIKQCLNICQSLEDNVCLNSCHEITLTQLKHDVLDSNQTLNESNSIPSTLSADTITQDVEIKDVATSSPTMTSILLRVLQTKTLRSDKSNSIKVYDSEFNATEDSKMTSLESEQFLVSFQEVAQNDSIEVKQNYSSEVKQMRSETVSGKLDQGKLFSYLQNYFDLLPTILEARKKKLTDGSSDPNIRYGSNLDLSKEEKNLQKNRKQLKLFYLGNFQNQKYVDRLLEANKMFLQREGFCIIQDDE